MTTEVKFLKVLSGTVHVIVDSWDTPAGGWKVKAVCGSRDLTGSQVKSDITAIQRHPDLCRACAAFLR